MSQPTDADFLLSCIVHSNSQVDIKKVAEELGYSNAGSAANRLAKLRKSHGSKTRTSTESKVTKPATKKSPKKRASRRKKKKEESESAEEEDGDSGDDEGNLEEKQEDDSKAE